VGLEIVSNHDGNASPLPGASHGSTHLLTEHISGASRSDSAIEPAIAPVHQTKAIDPPIIPRCFAAFVAHVAPCDTRRASASDERPPASHPGSIQVRLRQECEQGFKVDRKLTPQISFDQLMHG
jgi:hypothetical protein